VGVELTPAGAAVDLDDADQRDQVHDADQIQEEAQRAGGHDAQVSAGTGTVMGEVGDELRAGRDAHGE